VDTQTHRQDVDRTSLHLFFFSKKESGLKIKLILSEMKNSILLLLSTRYHELYRPQNPTPSVPSVLRPEEHVYNSTSLQDTCMLPFIFDCLSLFITYFNLYYFNSYLYFYNLIYIIDFTSSHIPMFISLSSSVPPAKNR
jgi:cellulose synthase/poly-beta-1,6-N-acetylglucosamine synthase-like glycosyltransferase